MSDKTPQTPSSTDAQPTEPTATPTDGGAQPTEPTKPTEPSATPNPEGAATEPTGQEPTQTPGTGQTPPSGVRNELPGGATPNAEGEGYEQKFADSTRENQRLMSILRDRGIDPETGQPTNPTANPNAPSFTDTQLEDAIPGFQFLSDDEKDVIRYAKKQAKDMAAMQRMVAEIHDERETNKQIANLKGQERFKDIAENEQLFREYIYKEENLQESTELLAYKFIDGLKDGSIKGTVEAAPEGEEPRPGMETGTAGAKDVTTTSGGKVEMTGAQAADLRKNDQRKYNKLVKSGKLVIVSGQ